MAGLPAKPTVPEVFDQVAAAYDRQVDLNPGYHANLRRAADALVERLPVAAARAPRLLDVGCGTGASTRALALTLWTLGRPTDITAVDGSAGMLTIARAKSWPDGVRFAHIRAEQVRTVLPHESADGSAVDGVFACYLLRNVEDPDAVLADLIALLPRHGVLAVHDYSVAGNPVAQAIWTLVCWTMVIPLGWLTARHTALYRYLWRSVLTFDSIPELVARLERAGLVDVEVRPATGWQRGILHTVIGRRP